MKHLMSSGNMVMSHWIFSWNWRNSRPVSSGLGWMGQDPGTLVGFGSIEISDLRELQSLGI